MFSTPEYFTENSPISPIQYVTEKKPSAIISLPHFYEALDVKHKTDVCRLGAAKSERKSIRSVNTCW